MHEADLETAVDGMTYREFFNRFMGSCRRKHLRPEPSAFGLLRGAVSKSSRSELINPTKGRAYRVPDGSEVPLGLMRMDPWEIEYLFALGTRAKVSILETGRCYGGSTFLLSCANRQVPIRSIDIAPQDDDRLRSIFSQVGVGENVEIIVGDSQRGEYPEIGDIDLLFIDGDHSFEGCAADLEQWYPRVVPGGHIVLHDCYFGSPVQEATIAFLERHDLEAIQGPYIVASHWRHPAGSLAHLRKTSLRRSAIHREQRVEAGA